MESFSQYLYCVNMRTFHSHLTLLGVPLELEYDRPFSYSRFRTGNSLQRRLMGKISFKVINIICILKDFSHQPQVKMVHCFIFYLLRS